MTSTHDFIVQENAAHKVVIWSKSFCPYCTKTKQTFAAMTGVTDVTIHELDQRSDGNEIQSELLKITGQRTVPNVFVMNQHIGGNDDTQRAKNSGKLSELLGL
jgi:glutaredoxin 3